jgi:NADPH2:quinone reductase
MDAGAEELEQIGDLVAAGEVHVEISETFPLDDAAAAHERSEAGHVRGKLVISIG